MMWCKRATIVQNCLGRYPPLPSGRRQRVTFLQESAESCKKLEDLPRAYPYSLKRSEFNFGKNPDCSEGKPEWSRSHRYLYLPHILSVEFRKSSSATANRIRYIGPDDNISIPKFGPAGNSANIKPTEQREVVSQFEKLVKAGESGQSFRHIHPQNFFRAFR
jgi:hypothetical protein